MALEFRPGFRFSQFDALILGLGAFGAIIEWPKTWWLGFVIGFVVGHFFLFCNVFRISRPPEMLWGMVFVLLTASTIFVGRPTWTETAFFSMAVTVAVIGMEMKKPSYHGVGWKFLNPNLQEWWEASVRASRGD